MHSFPQIVAPAKAGAAIVCPHSNPGPLFDERGDAVRLCAYCRWIAEPLRSSR